MYSLGSNMPYEDACASATGLLCQLSKEELQSLLNSEEKLKSIIDDIPQVKHIKDKNEEQLIMNKNLAEYNLSKEPNFNQAKEQLASTYEQGVEIQKAYEKHKGQLDIHSSEHSLDVTLALLQTEAAKTEEESEELANAFLDGNSEVEDFLSQYITLRTKSHLRKVKSEKLAEIYRQTASQRPGQLPPIQSPSTPKTPSWGSSAPYPTGNVSAMPNLHNYANPYR